jgi:hypothetical protein
MEYSALFVVVRRREYSTVIQADTECLDAILVGSIDSPSTALNAEEIKLICGC